MSLECTSYVTSINCTVIKRSSADGDGEEGRYLYNMLQDPGELRNEAKHRQALFRRLYRLLHEVPRAEFSKTTLRKVTLDEQQLEELRVLGYVGSDPVESDPGAGRQGPPRDPHSPPQGTLPRASP